MASLLTFGGKMGDHCKVGEGAYGTVYRDGTAIHKRLRDHETIAPSMLLRELAVLQHSSSPHIVSGTGAHMDEKGILVFTMRDGGQNLCDLMESGHIAEADTLNLTRQLLLGLQYLQSIDILHRDIKPSNIMVKAGQLKIGDFGLAVLAETPLDPHVCTRWYRPPEVELQAELQADEPCSRYSYPVDMWGAGCILGEMLLAAYHKPVPLFGGVHSEFTARNNGGAPQWSQLSIIMSVLDGLYEQQQWDRTALLQQFKDVCREYNNGCAQCQAWIAETNAKKRGDPAEPPAKRLRGKTGELACAMCKNAEPSVVALFPRWQATLCASCAELFNIPRMCWNRKYPRSLQNAPPAVVQQLLLPLLQPCPKARLSATEALDALEALMAPAAARPSSPTPPAEFHSWMGMSDESARLALQILVPGIY